MDMLETIILWCFKTASMKGLCIIRLVFRLIYQHLKILIQYSFKFSLHVSNAFCASTINSVLLVHWYKSDQFILHMYLLGSTTNFLFENQLLS